MLLTITTTHVPATDLGFLLGKNPARSQSFTLSQGEAHVFYPEASEARCTCALLLDVDPVGLVRGKKGEAPSLEPYVNDRPYVASSLLSVALSRVFGSALNGTSRDRPELAARAIPLEARLSAVPCRGGEGLLRGLFEPLGYALELERFELDARFPEWGASPYFRVTLRAARPLSELLSHLYVLVPVLDDAKHYFVASDEVDKLLAHGEGWLSAHPLRELIVQRALKRRRGLVDDALARLAPETEDEADAEEESDTEKDANQEVTEKSPAPVKLDAARRDAVCATLRSLGATSVIDLGCGEGRLLRALLDDARFTRITGVDVSTRALQIAARRLRYDTLPDKKKQRITLLHGSLTYADARFSGYDAAVLVEVIEHLDPERLPALERVVFERARPRAVLVTTPNREHNVRYEGVGPERLRHGDHRFEWTRAELRAWATRVAERFGYDVRFEGIGAPDEEVGAPTQLAVFTLRGAS